ncbi:MAG: hypothetical protein HPM95_08665 [Alphaproteobacteria bacterium]|nr:hypothetical protein [Alphaproteobacteria bacterium]
MARILAGQKVTMVAVAFGKPSANSPGSGWRGSARRCAPPTARFPARQVAGGGVRSPSWSRSPLHLVARHAPADGRRIAVPGGLCARSTVARWLARHVGAGPPPIRRLEPWRHQRARLSELIHLDIKSQPV